MAFELETVEKKMIEELSSELKISKISFASVLKLLKEGNTIPFIARYRKEATGNLDEVAIRAIDEKSRYFMEVEERRKTILESIEGQGKLTEELKNSILECKTKNGLEDLYLPYKPKRRTRAMIAREKGLLGLAMRIWELPNEGHPLKEAESYISLENEVDSAEKALSLARDIVAELFSELPLLREELRQFFFDTGVVSSKIIEGKEQEGIKFKDYYDFKEKVSKIPSHRFLAIRRGEKENVLDYNILIEEEEIFNKMLKLQKWHLKSPFSEEYRQAAKDGFKRLMMPGIETDVRVELKQKSDRAAVDVFAENLKHLLMSSPFGSKKVLGIDPGLRTGCKLVAIDATGAFLENDTLYLTQGEEAKKRAKLTLLKFIKQYEPEAIAIGNGTAGRETETFVKEVLAQNNLKDIIVVSVNESGASVYSASENAREEFPDLDLTVRGSISIGRRLQDPLAELVKIDPKAIGVGQYQHDVFQPLLQEQLSHVVESCVNKVGVELNTASVELLSYVSGIGPSMAKKIVSHRTAQGAFKSRTDLLKISGFGQKTFEQAAGFLRIHGGNNPLDASQVHPERYEVVEAIAKDLNVPLTNLIGNDKLLTQINLKKFINKDLGELTLLDIIEELKKPGRDPRNAFERPIFRDDILEMKDLKPGMILEGIVTNVTEFGAFVDIGVHQDGLVHVSHLSDRFIKNPREVVTPGQKIKVKVLEVDIPRKRISLTCRLNEREAPAVSKNTKDAKAGKQGGKPFFKSPFDSL